MDILQELIIPLSTLGAIVVAIVLYITKKDARSEVHEAVFEEKFKNIDTKLTLMLTNHLPHMDAKIDQICTAVSDMDKKLYAHLQNHE